ncbi:hypothetical protein [Methanosarcina sp. MSH10X1]|uniref:hypothetical protein n=1 Tax=Methanosarcina sp. MSH10X1 TaxID=2507075 RepID=UPI00197B6817|nr:hypothetical protein [Methanosarcina sp. MSH10X1]
MVAFLCISDRFENLLNELSQSPLLAVNRFKNITKPAKKTCTLLFRDERGMLEPHADLLSVALAVIGFMVFATLMSQTYFGYEDRSFALENYESASLLAQSLADDPMLRAGGSGLLSAAAIDTLSGPAGASERARLFAAFSGNYRFLVEIKTGDGQWSWQIVPDNIEPEAYAGGKEKVAASVPIVIKLNPAQSVPGILTVVIYKAAWT